MDRRGPAVRLRKLHNLSMWLLNAQKRPKNQLAQHVLSVLSKRERCSGKTDRLWLRCTGFRSSTAPPARGSSVAPTRPPTKAIARRQTAALSRRPHWDARAQHAACSD